MGCEQGSSRGTSSRVNEEKGEIMNKQQIIDKMWDVWIHVGSARDNEEPVDCDWVQQQLFECKEALEQLN
jgi:hypothetical protein